MTPRQARPHGNPPTYIRGDKQGSLRKLPRQAHSSKTTTLTSYRVAREQVRTTLDVGNFAKDHLFI